MTVFCWISETSLSDLAPTFRETRGRCLWKFSTKWWTWELFKLHKQLSLFIQQNVIVLMNGEFQQHGSISFVRGLRHIPWIAGWKNVGQWMRMSFPLKMMTFRPSWGYIKSVSLRMSKTPIQISSNKGKLPKNVAGSVGKRITNQDGSFRSKQVIVYFFVTWWEETCQGDKQLCGKPVLYIYSLLNWHSSLHKIPSCSIL